MACDLHLIEYRFGSGVVRRSNITEVSTCNKDIVGTTAMPPKSLAASDKSHTPPNNKFIQTLSSYKFTIHTHALNTNTWSLLLQPHFSFNHSLKAVCSSRRDYRVFKKTRSSQKKLDWSIDYCAHNPKEATKGHFLHMFFPNGTRTHNTYAMKGTLANWCLEKSPFHTIWKI